MEEADALCSTCGFLVDGRLAAIGTPNTLKAKLSETYQLHLRVNVQASGNVNPSSDSGAQAVEKAIEFVRREIDEGASMQTRVGGRLRIAVRVGKQPTSTIDGTSTPPPPSSPTPDSEPPTNTTTHLSGNKAMWLCHVYERLDRAKVNAEVPGL
ncbi:hypothetical protein HK102_012637, partial [Quaeritorhiza haematococci]